MGCLLATILTGCNAGPFGGSATLVDAQRDQPLGADGQRAKMRGSASWGFVKIYDKMEWISAGTRHDPFEVARIAERFSPRPVLHPVYASGNINARYQVYLDRRTIVCIDPIVVVVTEGRKKVAAYRMDGDIEMGTMAAYFKRGTASVFLPHGYEYGTKFRADGETHWYSPTLGTDLTPLPPDCKEATLDISTEDSKRSISLSRSGSWWRVREGEPD